MEAEHFPLSRGSRHSTGRAARRQAQRDRFKNPEAAAEAGGEARPVLTFLRAAVLQTGGQVVEAVGGAQAAAVVEGLAGHGGHVEEVLPQQGATGTHLLGESADLGDFWRDADEIFELVVWAISKTGGMLLKAKKAPDCQGF